MEAFEHNLIFAENIFISYEHSSISLSTQNSKDQLSLYIIQSETSNRFGGYTPLKVVLENSELEASSKHQIFFNLISAVNELHDIGIVHGEVSPKTIWVNEQLKTSFSVPKLYWKNESPKERIYHSDSNKDHMNSENQNRARLPSNFWYMAPELLFDNFKKTTTRRNTKSKIDFPADLWSLGCIFAEIFATITPLFQSVNLIDYEKKISQVIIILYF